MKEIATNYLTNLHYVTLCTNKQKIMQIKL